MHKKYCPETNSCVKNLAMNVSCIISGLFFAVIAVTVAKGYFRLRKVNAMINRLKEIAEIRGIFVNITAHELRNPMSTIYSAMDLLENYNQQLSKQDQCELFNQIRKGIKRMDHIMDNVILIGRLQHKKVKYIPKPVNVLEICSSIIHNLPDDNSKNRVHIYCNADQQITYPIDSILFEYIVTNLLSNALKYSDRDVALNISTHMKQLQIDIIDHGIGIPPEDLGQMSQLFHRCTNTGNRKGIGIGMYLAVHCVKLHQGSIKVASKLNSGTHFRVTLPIAYENGSIN